MQGKWSNRFEGADMFLTAMLGLALTAPGYSARDVTDWLDGQGVSAGRLRKQLVTIPGGPFAMFLHSDEFQWELRTRLFPLVRGHAADALTQTAPAPLR